MDPATGIGIGTLLDFLGKHGRDVWRVVMFVVLVVAAVLLGGSAGGVLPQRVEAFVDENYAVVFIALIAAAAFFGYEGIAWLAGRLGHQNRPARLRKRLEQSLQSLTPQERSILGEFMRRDQRTLNLPAETSGLRTLFRRGLIACEESPHLIGKPFLCDFTVPDHVWDYLQEVRRSP